MLQQPANTQCLPVWSCEVSEQYFTCFFRQTLFAVGHRAVSSHWLFFFYEAGAKLHMFAELEANITRIKSKCGSTTCRPASTSWSHFFRYYSEFLILNITRLRQYKACAPLKVALLVEQAIRDVRDLGAFLSRTLNAALKEQCTTGAAPCHGV